MKLARGLLLYFISITLFGCVSSGPAPSGGAPGSGKIAARSFTTTTPVISALERYKAEKGVYPNDIKQLYPHFMTIVPKMMNGYPLEYRREKQDYRLSFRYREDRVNECVYTPGTDWACRAL